MYLEDFDGGGIQKVSLVLAGALIERGYPLDLLVCRNGGALTAMVPEAACVTELPRAPLWKARQMVLTSRAARLPHLAAELFLSPTLTHLPALVRALVERRPAALYTATPFMNVEAALAQKIAGTATRVITTEHNAISRGNPLAAGWHGRLLPRLMRAVYPMAAANVAVSDGVAEDLAAWAGIERARITTIYNPVVTPELLAEATHPVAHPWLQGTGPPVILAAGRLGRAKDFRMLIRAFAILRRQRAARLIILGKVRSEKKTAKRIAELEAIARGQGVADDVDLPGFVANPIAYNSRASLFALSSINEGLPGVLIQALACGCPVVSTNCPSGPFEILDGGRYGLLVPVGDADALAKAMATTLDAPPEREALRRRAELFNVDRAVSRYEALMVPLAVGA
jgi:glycosyltransferase involved in cell wall biosynthesis